MTLNKQTTLNRKPKTKVMSINWLNTNYKKLWQLPALFSLTIIWTMNVQVQAEPRGIDVFSINSHNNAGTGNLPRQNNSEHSPIKIWFEKFDALREQYHPSDKDKVILTRPLMQNAQRVQQFTNTASKISKNYMLLAKSIRGLAVPPGASDVKEYRDLVADWFQDSAAVYKDLIRPRPPAKTIEDLHEELDALKKRSESLVSTMATLKTMERQVRQAHNVPTAEQDDPLQKFVHGK